MRKSLHIGSPYIDTIETTFVATADNQVVNFSTGTSVQSQVECGSCSHEYQQSEKVVQETHSQLEQCHGPKNLSHL